ncbi:uncharacterized protein EDB93DRAFT_1339933 [Suillus bovinus]|uniref:uncharacterized protein n=1 Tax=Suillus bovinus TaxID=48563 RepID=UPI001B87F2C0|nr:uncharacterized protein EDB93DRAFT_1339933 [Suillus bovinus]KAG2133615.1 hypothetical protein EDB93DRAFT_1339933 [Suillus bovinus]
MTVTVYESSDEEEYSFKTRVEASDNSQSSTQPLAKVPKEKLSTPQEITPRSPRVDTPLRKCVLRDEMHGIAKGDLSLLIRILLLSIIQTNDRVGQRFQVGTAEKLREGLLGGPGPEDLTPGPTQRSRTRGLPTPTLVRGGLRRMQKKLPSVDCHSIIACNCKVKPSSNVANDVLPFAPLPHTSMWPVLTPALWFLSGRLQEHITDRPWTTTGNRPRMGQAYERIDNSDVETPRMYTSARQVSNVLLTLMRYPIPSFSVSIHYIPHGSVCFCFPGKQCCTKRDLALGLASLHISHFTTAKAASCSGSAKFKTNISRLKDYCAALIASGA